MQRVYVAMGSNEGDREAALRAATAALRKVPDTLLVGTSPIYETPPVGPIGQGPYLNAVVRLETDLSPRALLAHLQAIEQDAGRDAEGTERRVRWGPRVLDLDILLFGREVVSEDGLDIPHPLMHDRWFVLRPLADLNPNAVHPLLEMTAGALLDDLETRANARESGRGERYDCGPLLGR